MDYKAIYEEWLSNPYFDEATKAELRAIADDDKEIKERFYKDLEFGTAGLRGIIGAGINRMNIYVVRRATQGLANYIIKQGGQGKGVAIAYDSRHMSPEFAEEAALTLAANGIKAYKFESLRHRSCRLQYVSLAVSQVLISLPATIRQSTMDTKYTGRMEHSLLRLMIKALPQRYWRSLICLR